MDTDRKRKFHETIHAIARNAENLARHLHNAAGLLGISAADAEDEEQERDKTKKSKRPKLVDPEEPEKPQRAYNYFIKENYSAVQKKFPNENTRIMIELAALWKETSSKDRKQYEDLANKDKKRYEIEKQKFEAYRLNHPFDEEKEGITVNAKRLQRRQAEADTSSGNRTTEKEELERGSNDDSSSSTSSSSRLIDSDESSDSDLSDFNKREIPSNKKINNERSNEKGTSFNKKVNNRKYKKRNIFQQKNQSKIK